MKLKGRHFLTLLDYSPDEIRFLIRLSMQFKERYYAGELYTPVHLGKSVIMIFEKPSTRTRVSISSAAWQLGMNVIYASPQELQLGRGEAIADTARVLSRYVNAIVARVYRHTTLEEMAEYSRVPVVNALSDLYHPMQALADAMTLVEKFGERRKLKVAFVGDVGNNVARSLAVVGAKLGWELRLVGPKDYWHSKDFLGLVEEVCRSTGGEIRLVEEVEEGVRGVDVVYTDVWVSMGQEAEREERLKRLSRYKVDEKVMSLAGRDAIFMHCLPAHRGEEVEDSVIDGPRSAVWDQAENRLHTAKALLAALVE